VVVGCDIELDKFSETAFYNLCMRKVSVREKFLYEKSFCMWRQSESSGSR